jgi:hypothetical protein
MTKRRQILEGLTYALQNSDSLIQVILLTEIASGATIVARKQTK